MKKRNGENWLYFLVILCDLGVREKWSFGHAKIMKECKESVKVYILVDKARTKSRVLNIFLLVYWSHMAEDVLVVLTRVVAIAIWDHCVHTEFSVLTLFNKMSSHCRSHHICYIRMFFGEIGRKIHLFPTIFLFDELHAWKTKVLSDSFSLYEIYKSVSIWNVVLMG